ncbi:MAG: hypothetical protein AAGF97_10545, partial [Planctomycetota bacterium]
TGDAYFPGGLGEMVFDTSFLDFEVGPSQELTLQWATYYDAADEAGISRLWGGIHIPDDDFAGRIMGSVIGLDAYAHALTFFLPDGDFNNDGMFDCLDADALVAEIVGATDSVEFDLNGDGAVNGDDLTAWLAQAGAENLNSGNSYLIGDANLDGTVDGQDFLAWNANKFTATASWCGGDFNADGTVDGMDFVLWNANKFQSANATVPEPQLGLVGLLMTSVLLWRRRRQRGH